MRDVHHSVLGISCTKCGQVVHVKGFDINDWSPVMRSRSRRIPYGRPNRCGFHKSLYPASSESVCSTLVTTSVERAVSVPKCYPSSSAAKVLDLVAAMPKAEAQTLPMRTSQLKT